MERHLDAADLGMVAEQEYQYGVEAFEAWQRKDGKLTLLCKEASEKKISKKCLTEGKKNAT